MIAILSLGTLEPLSAQEPVASASPPVPIADDSSAQVATEPVTPPTTPEEAEQLRQRLYPDPPDSTPEASPEANSPQAPWKLTLSAKASAIYDSNIFIASDHAKGDFVFNVSPGVTFGYGDFRQREENFIVLDYDLGIILFADHTEEDAIEQQASLSAQMHFARLTFGLTFRFQDLSGPDVDAGARTRRNLYDTALFNKYDVSDKTYVEVNFQNNVSNYETRLDSVDSLVRLWWNYHWSPNITFGTGLSGGILNVEESKDQTYEQALGRVIYSATTKLSFQADGGIELRQTDDNHRATPVFSLAGTYLPFEGTQLKFSGYRHVQNSAVFVGEDYSATGAKIELQHSWRDNCDLLIEAGYEHSDYNSVIRGAGPSRTDDSFFVRPAVQLKLVPWAQTELFYEYRHNDSTLSSFSFRDSQVGIQINFAL